jgi:chaperonin GroES
MKDRILVQMIAEPERGLIVIPEKYRQDPHIGTVLAVGPGKRIDGERKPLDVKVGEQVAFGRFTDWAEGGMVIIQEADIMFKLDKPVKIGIDKFEHNAVGVERFAGSLEDRYEKTQHG